jgi:serine protease Do
MAMKIKNIILPFICTALVLSLMLTSGCQLLSRTEQSNTISTTTTTQTVKASTSNTKVTLPTTSTYTQPLPSIADVVAKVKPSVVAINVKSVVTTYDFFGRAFQQEQEGAGSGWIISTGGLIVTNNHVVEGASSIMITFNDGSSLPADLTSVKTDALTDLAILKVDATSLPAVSIGDSTKLREGEWVVAIGNSLGEGIRVTQGIVSRKDVSMQDENGQTLTGLIETDAVINPGNSGGPLVNMAGEVIGITNAKRVQTGVEGVGYAISSNEAFPIIQDLISNGYIVRPYLGISTETIVNASYARWYGLRVNSGVRITAVSADGPAGKVGIQINDVIVKFNDQDITEAQQLTDAIHHAKIGQTVEITYWRGTEQQTIKIVLTETPKPQ